MICRLQTISCYAFKNQKAAPPYSGPIDVVSDIAGAAGSAAVFYYWVFKLLVQMTISEGYYLRNNLCA